MNNTELSADLVRDLIKERRRDRRWRNIRFFLGLCLMAFILYQIFSPATSVEDELDGKGYVSLVNMDGMIAPGASFSADEVVPLLKQAFADKRAKGVILDINSGGGTPVQASIIHDEIIKLKQKYHKKVVVVGEDLLTSGAYFVAVSGDKIYVNPNTITGSIGVVMEGFGLSGLIQKVGVERRVYTAGAHKDRLDQFLPTNPEDVTKINTVLAEVHQNFSDTVKAGRAGKLKGDLTELFSGDFWTGQTAVSLGLVDGLGDVWDVMQNEFHVSHAKKYSGSAGLLKSIASQLGSVFNLPTPNEKMHLVSTL